MNYMTLPGIRRTANLRLFGPGEFVKITKERILFQILKRYGYSFDDLLNKSRSHEIVFARQVFMFLMKKRTSLSVTKIGKLLGKHHTTVLHACKQVQDIIDTEENARNEIINILDELDESH